MLCVFQKKLAAFFVGTDGVSSVEGKAHSRQRRILNQHFEFGNLKVRGAIARVSDSSASRVLVPVSLPLQSVIPLFVGKAEEQCQQWLTRLGSKVNIRLYSAFVHGFPCLRRRLLRLLLEQPAMEVDMVVDMTNLTLDIIGVSGFGTEFGAVAGQNSTIHHAYRTLFGALLSCFLFPTHRLPLVTPSRFVLTALPPVPQT